MNAIATALRAASIVFFREEDDHVFVDFRDLPDSFNVVVFTKRFGFSYEVCDKGFILRT